MDVVPHPFLFLVVFAALVEDGAVMGLVAVSDLVEGFVVGSEEGQAERGQYTLVSLE